MRKNVKRVLVAVLVAGAMVTFVGCGNKENVVNNNTGNVTNNSTNNANQVKDIKSNSSFSTGAWNDNVYTNNFLGIVYTIPEGWTHYSDEEMNQMNEITEDTKEVDLSQKEIVYHAAATNTATGNSIQIYSEKVSQNMSAEDYINTIKSHLASLSSINYTVSEITEATIGGRVYYSFSAEASMFGQKTVQKYYVVKVNDYFVTINTTAYNDTEVDINRYIK